MQIYIEGIFKLSNKEHIWPINDRNGEEVTCTLLQQNKLNYYPFHITAYGMKDEGPMPTNLEDYLFDLRGYLILKGALSKSEVAALNQGLDDVPPLQRNEWHGAVHRQDQADYLGVNLQQIYEAGAPFEALIDHPSWIEHLNRYVGGDDGLYIDENFANLRGPGEAINLHSGGHKRRIRTQFRFHNNMFRCGEVNILLALTDIGPGDGATMVIPGSHKSNLVHPQFEEKSTGVGADNIEGAIEVHLDAGDAILFVDAIAHGSAQRKNPGQRRIMVYRYGPQWSYTRYGYEPSAELLQRLTPARRKIVQPIPPRRPPHSTNGAATVTSSSDVAEY
jgi:hypothetical protein